MELKTIKKFISTIKNMKNKKQNYVTFVSLAFTICLASCDKILTKRDTIYRGRIMNTVDSLPYANTQFKFYRYGDNSAKTADHLFKTNAEGYFDESVQFATGVLCWPNFFNGSAYNGPAEVWAIAASKDPSTGNTIKEFGTVYMPK
jgi:hypothetical protein